MRFLAPLSLVVALAALLVAVLSRPEPTEPTPAATAQASGRVERSGDPLPTTTVVAGDDGSVGALRGIIGSLLARVDGLERTLAASQGAQAGGGELAALRVELDALREDVVALRADLTQIRRELRHPGRNMRSQVNEEGLRVFPKNTGVRLEKPKK